MSSLHVHTILPVDYKQSSRQLWPGSSFCSYGWHPYFNHSL